MHVTSYASCTRLPTVLFNCTSCFGQATILIVIKMFVCSTFYNKLPLITNPSIMPPIRNARNTRSSSNPASVHYQVCVCKTPTFQQSYLNRRPANLEDHLSVRQHRRPLKCKPYLLLLGVSFSLLVMFMYSSVF